MDTARYTEYFDADGNYHAVLDGHAVTIPYSAIVCDMDTGMDTDMDADADAASRRLHPLRVPRRPVGGGGRAPSG